jgi:hypothetical protein
MAPSAGLAITRKEATFGTLDLEGQRGHFYAIWVGP